MMPCRDYVDNLTEISSTTNYKAIYREGGKRGEEKGRGHVEDVIGVYVTGMRTKSFIVDYGALHHISPSP